MEVLKLIVSALTPIAVVILGLLLLRRIESVKTSVATQSDFRRRWADQFFECCQRYMQVFEKDMALLQTLNGITNPDSPRIKQLHEEISALNPVIMELELRIRRSVVFSPKSAAQVKASAQKCLSLLSALLAKNSGNFDEIIAAMNDFNRAARAAHAEMIGMEYQEI